MNDVETAWVSGYLEGEGSFIVREMEGGIYPHVGAVSTDLDVLQRLCALVGGYIHGPSCRPNHKPIWHWRLERQSEARELMVRLLPHMGLRRQERIREVLASTKSEDQRGIANRRRHAAAHQ